MQSRPGKPSRRPSNAAPAAGKSAGRPRQFDADRALDRALQVFWRRGYEGATLAELTKAMRINRPSLYAAFGDKASLFRRALDRYAAQHACHVEQALAEPTARAVVERLWRGNIELVSGERGCLLVHGALACSSTAQAVQRELAKRRAAGERLLRGRFEQALAEGDLPRGAKPAQLARYAATVSYGMSVQAAGGASAAELREVAAVALEAFPEAAR